MFQERIKLGVENVEPPMEYANCHLVSFNPVCRSREIATTIIRQTYYTVGFDLYCCVT